MNKTHGPPTIVAYLSANNETEDFYKEFATLQYFRDYLKFNGNGITCTLFSYYGKKYESLKDFDK